MIVALHEAPRGFFKTDPPYDSDGLLRFVRKTASLGFKAIEIGPLTDYSSIDGERLRRLLDKLNMKRSVHVGGLFDASKFASTEEEYGRMKRQIRRGTMLCDEIHSSLLSIHPPFFEGTCEPGEEFSKAAKARFFKLVKREIEFARRYNVKVALESFCYRPFIFRNIGDFGQFVSKFRLEELGVLLDVGHLYQARICLSEAVHVFKDRLMDVHVHDATLGRDYRKATHLPIGKGAIDFSSLIRLLRAVCYAGWLTLEVRGSEKEIGESKGHLQSLIARR
jgi:sugar phosphate isomerase/epimerase